MTSEVCFSVPALIALQLLLPVLALLLYLLRQGRAKVDRSTHTPGLKVVITGSCRGLGLQLAREFLALGDDVVITARQQAIAEATARELGQEFEGRKVVGVVCDVTRPEDVDKLVATAVRELGQVDILVANAGQTVAAKAPVAQSSVEELQGIVGTNLLGALLCARAGIAQMLTQTGGGKVFLVDGAGSRGNATPGSAAYGATKAALVQLTKSLAAEVKGTHVAVHLCSPGMVATDLLLRHATNPRSAKFINVLAEKPETVAAWLVPRMRGVEGKGCYFRFLTFFGVLGRFLTARWRRGRFVPEGGVGGDGYERMSN